MKRTILLACCLLFLGDVPQGDVPRGDTPPSGAEIMQKSFSRDERKDVFFRIKMLLLDKNGNEQRRDLKMYRKHYPDNTTKIHLEGATLQGTDFTDLDLQPRQPDRDTHTLMRREIFDNYNCYVVESTPKDDSPYSKRLSWVDAESWVIMKVYYYNKEGEHVKTFMVQDLDKRQGVWTPIQVKMEDLQKKHKTTMTVLEAR